MCRGKTETSVFWPTLPQRVFFFFNLKKKKSYPGELGKFFNCDPITGKD